MEMALKIEPFRSHLSRLTSGGLVALGLIFIGLFAFIDRFDRLTALIELYG